jgi:hypothetical protein
MISRVFIAFSIIYIIVVTGVFIYMVRHRVSYRESILLGEFVSLSHRIQTNGNARNHDLINWLLENGFRIGWPANLMTIGPYQEPLMPFLPSLAY